MNQLKTPLTETASGENTGLQRVLVGTITLSGLLMAVSAYFLTILFRQPPTTINYIALAVLTSVMIASVAGIVLSFRKQHLLGLQISFIATNMIGIMAAGLFIGRTLPSSLSIMTISMIIILWVMPDHLRRRYAVGAAMVFALTWLLELISPPWRIELATTATVGPPAAVVFVIVMFVIAARQAWGGNIRTKLITAFTIVALASLGILGTATYVSFRNQVREDIRQRLFNIVSLAALQQNTELHAALHTTEDTNSTAYTQAMAINDAILATDPDLIFVYTMRQNDAGQIYFVIDASLDPEYESVTVGTIYEEPSDLLIENFATLDQTIVETDIYTDEFGSFLSAYTPFYDQNGVREGVIGVDINADFVIAQERAVLFLILRTIAAAIVLVTMIGLFLGNVFTKPIIDLSNTAQKIADGDLNTRAVVQTTDEVGDLSIILNAMTSRLQGTLQGLERRVAERTRNLELAAQVGRSVSQVRTLDYMLKDSCELILKEFDLYYVQVYLVNENASALKLEAGTGTVGAQLLGRNHSLPLDNASINSRAAAQKQAVVISDTTQSSTFRPNPLLPETRGEMAVPLVVGDKVVGVLDMQANQPGVLTNEILPAFEALAGQMAVAIQNANLLAETQQARAEVEAQARRLIREGWNEHLDAIHKPEKLGFVFDQNKITPITDADASSINDEKTISALIAVTGESLGSLVVELEDEARTEQVSELVNIVARQVAQQIENLRLLESAERYRAESERAARLQTIEGWQKYIETRTAGSLGYLYDTKEVRPQQGNGDAGSSMFAMPLKAREEMIGKLMVEGLTQDDQESVELVNAVAERLSAHIDNLRLFEETRLGQLELNKRAQQLAAVAEVSTASSRELDIQSLLASVVHLTQRKFGLYHAHVFLFNEETEELAIAACGWKEGDEHEGTHGTTKIPLHQEQSLVARAARTKQAVIVNDVKNEPGWLPNPLLPDTASELSVPMIIGDELLGVLDIQSDRINAFNEEDASIQTTLASQVATALQNAKSFARAQQQAQRESTLNVINQKIQSATTVEAVLQIAARELGHALGAPMTIAQLSLKENDTSS